MGSYWYFVSCFTRFADFVISCTPRALKIYCWKFSRRKWRAVNRGTSSINADSTADPGSMTHEVSQSNSCFRGLYQFPHSYNNNWIMLNYREPVRDLYRMYLSDLNLWNYRHEKFPLWWGEEECSKLSFSAGSALTFWNCLQLRWVSAL